MTKTLSFCPSSYSVCLQVTCRIISFLPSGEIALSMIFRKVSFTLRGISSGQFFGNLMLQKSFFDVILIFPLSSSIWLKITDFLKNFVKLKYSISRNFMCITWHFLGTIFQQPLCCKNPTLIFPLIVNLAKNNRFFKTFCEIKIFNFTEFYVHYVAFPRDNFS